MQTYKLMKGTCLKCENSQLYLKTIKDLGFCSCMESYGEGSDSKSHHSNYRPIYWGSPKHVVMASLAFCVPVLSSLFFFSLKPKSLQRHAHKNSKHKSIFSFFVNHKLYLIRTKHTKYPKSSEKVK